MSYPVPAQIQLTSGLEKTKISVYIVYKFIKRILEVAFITAFKDFYTATGRWFWKYTVKTLRSKPFAVFAVLLVLAVIFNTVFVPLSYIFVLAAYLSGFVLVFWMVSAIIPD